MRKLSKFIYFKLLGWKVVGNKNFSKDVVKKAVLIAVPHTSWHDFYIGVLLRQVVGIKSNFIAKKELFVGPLGWYLKRIGGAPINRKSKENNVEDKLAVLYSSQHREDRQYDWYGTTQPSPG